MQKVLLYIRRYPLSLLCIAAIWYLCLFRPPKVESLSGIVGFDKVVHVCMYLGSCSIIWWEYLRSHVGINYKRLLFWALIVPIVMSGVVELAQEYLTTYRGGDWTDFAANSTGALLAALLGQCVLRRIILRKRAGKSAKPSDS